MNEQCVGGGDGLVHRRQRCVPRLRLAAVTPLCHFGFPGWASPYGLTANRSSHGLARQNSTASGPHLPGPFPYELEVVMSTTGSPGSRAN